MSVQENIQISRIDRITVTYKKKSSTMNVTLFFVFSLALTLIAGNKKSTGPLTDKEETLVDIMLQAISFEIPPERYAAAYEVLATFVHSLHPTKEMPISKITFKKDKDGLYLHHEQECRDELNALFKLWGITVDHAMAKYMLHQWLKQILSKDMYRPMSNVKKDEDKPEHIIKHNRRHLLEEMLPWVIETEWGITEGLLMDCYKDQLLFHLDGNMKDLAKTFFQLVNAIWGSPQPKTRKPQLSPLRI